MLQKVLDKKEARMKFENEELDKETLDRLEKHGILLSKHASALSRDKALVLIGEAMMDKFVKEIKEFVSLWKNELFPDCRLQDFEASEEEKQQFLGKRDFNENSNIKASERDNNDRPEQKEKDEASLDYCDTRAEERNAAAIASQPILDIYASTDGGYWFVTKKRKKNGKQLLSGYVKSGWLPRLTKFYGLPEEKLSKPDPRIWKVARKAWHHLPKVDVPKVYKKQRVSKPDWRRTATHKALESYLS